RHGRTAVHTLSGLATVHAGSGRAGVPVPVGPVPACPAQRPQALGRGGRVLDGPGEGRAVRSGAGDPALRPLPRDRPGSRPLLSPRSRGSSHGTLPPRLTATVLGELG